MFSSQCIFDKSFSRFFSQRNAEKKKLVGNNSFLWREFWSVLKIICSWFDNKQDAILVEIHPEERTYGFFSYLQIFGQKIDTQFLWRHQLHLFLFHSIMWLTFAAQNVVVLLPYVCICFCYLIIAIESNKWNKTTHFALENY